MTHSSDKILPILFVKGYLYAVQSNLGNGSFQALHQHAARVLAPDQTVREHWLAPLRSCLTYGTPDPPGIDYNLVSLFHAGLTYAYPIQGVHLMSERIGMQWWLGEPPISIYHYVHDLHTLFVPTIRAQLRPHQWGGGRTSHSDPMSPQQLARLGVTTFIDAVQQQSGLAWMIEHEPDRMILLLEECPFCVGHTDSCRVWWGVVQGLIDWLHSAHHRNELSQKVELDREQSTSHQLIITYVNRKPKEKP